MKNTNRLKFLGSKLQLFLMLLLLVPILSFSQSLRERYNEAPDDSYVL